MYQIWAKPTFGGKYCKTTQIWYKKSSLNTEFWPFQNGQNPAKDDNNIKSDNCAMTGYHIVSRLGILNPVNFYCHTIYIDSPFSHSNHIHDPSRPIVSLTKNLVIWMTKRTRLYSCL